MCTVIGAQSAIRILCGLFPDHLPYGGMEAGMHSQFDQFGLPDSYLPLDGMILPLAFPRIFTKKLAVI